MTDYTAEQAANVFAGRAFDDCGCSEANGNSLIASFDVAASWTTPVDGTIVDLPGVALGKLLAALKDGDVDCSEEAVLQALEYTSALDTAINGGDWQTVFEMTPEFYAATGGLYENFLDSTGTPAYGSCSSAYDNLENCISSASEAADAAQSDEAGPTGPGEPSDPEEGTEGSTDPDAIESIVGDAVGADPADVVLNPSDTGDDSLDEAIQDANNAGQTIIVIDAPESVPDLEPDPDEVIDADDSPIDPGVMPEDIDGLDDEDSGEDDPEDGYRAAVTWTSAHEEFKARGKNWVEQEGGLPHYIKRIAKHLVERGMTQSHAIAAAVNTVKRWARGGEGVKADTVAKSLAALAEWEAKKAAAHAHGGATSVFAGPGLHKDGTPPVCKFCANTSTGYAMHAEGAAYVPFCADHQQTAVDAIGGKLNVDSIGQYGAPVAPAFVEGWDSLPVSEGAHLLVDSLDAVASQVLTVSNDLREVVGMMPAGTRAAGGHFLGDDIDALAEVAEAFRQTSREKITSLVASVAGESPFPVAPPKAWFDDPKFSAVTPITVTKDGYISGHLASWDACHMMSRELGQRCLRAPRSGNGYAGFHLGYVTTAEGVDVPTGRIVAGAPHADPAWGLDSTLVHYSHSGWVGADVRVGEDRYGLWIAGAVRPDVTPNQLRALKAAPLSGDWRTNPKSGKLELVAALGVTAPGFQIPRMQALVASIGTVSSMQAVGLVAPKQIVLQNGVPVLPREELAYLKERAASAVSWSADANRMAEVGLATRLAAERVETAARIASFARSRKMAAMKAAIDSVKEMR